MLRRLWRWSPAAAFCVVVFGLGILGILYDVVTLDDPTLPEPIRLEVQHGPTEDTFVVEPLPLPEISPPTSSASPEPATLEDLIFNACVDDGFSEDYCEDELDSGR